MRKVSMLDFKARAFAASLEKLMTSLKLASLRILDRCLSNYNLLP